MELYILCKVNVFIKLGFNPIKHTIKNRPNFKINI